MSSRLVTTPWFTKNLAGGCAGHGLLLRGTRDGRDGGDGTRRGRRSDGAAADRADLPRMIRAMLLAVDIGNSNVTIGSFRNGSLVAVRRAATAAPARRRTSWSSSSRACSASTTRRSPTSRRSSLRLGGAGA